MVQVQLQVRALQAQVEDVQDMRKTPPTTPTSPKITVLTRSGLGMTAQIRHTYSLLKLTQPLFPPAKQKQHSW